MPLLCRCCFGPVPFSTACSTEQSTAFRVLPRVISQRLSAGVTLPHAWSNAWRRQVRGRRCPPLAPANPAPLGPLSPRAPAFPLAPESRRAPANQQTLASLPAPTRSGVAGERPDAGEDWWSRRAFLPWRCSLQCQGPLPHLIYHTCAVHQIRNEIRYSNDYPIRIPQPRKPIVNTVDARRISADSTSTNALPGNALVWAVCKLPE